MKRFFNSITAFLLPFAVFFTVYSREPETVVPLKEYRESAALVLESRYSEAESVFDRFIEDHPAEPAGYLMKASVIRYAAVDYETGGRNEEIEKLLRHAEKLANKRLKDREDITARFFLFSSRSLRGTGSLSGGNIVSGLALSHSGARGLMNLAESHPDYADAYLGAGCYRFWKSVSLGRARNIPFVDDERERGLDEVRLAIEKGRLSGPLSNTMLLEMLLAYDVEAAAELGGRLCNEYPECRIFAWQYGEALKKLKRFDDARGIFERLAIRYSSDPVDDGSGALRCWWKLAVLARDTGRKAECREYCARVIACGTTPTVHKRQAVRIESAKRMLREMGNDTEGKGSRR